MECSKQTWVFWLIHPFYTFSSTDTHRKRTWSLLWKLSASKLSVKLTKILTAWTTSICMGLIPIFTQTYHTEEAFPAFLCLTDFPNFQDSFRKQKSNRSSVHLHIKWLRRTCCSHMIIKGPFPGSALVGNTLKVFLFKSLPSFQFVQQQVTWLPKNSL